MSICAERGEQPEAPFSGRFTVRLTPEQHRKILDAAEKVGQNVDAWVADTLTHAVAA